jgi:hypothetical protein
VADTHEIRCGNSFRENTATDTDADFDARVEPHRCTIDRVSEAARRSGRPPALHRRPSPSSRAATIASDIHLHIRFNVAFPLPFDFCVLLVLRFTRPSKFDNAFSEAIPQTRSKLRERACRTLRAVPAHSFVHRQRKLRFSHCGIDVYRNGARSSLPMRQAAMRILGGQPVVPYKTPANPANNFLVGVLQQSERHSHGSFRARSFPRRL